MEKGKRTERGRKKYKDEAKRKGKGQEEGIRLREKREEKGMRKGKRR